MELKLTRKEVSTFWFCFMIPHGLFLTDRFSSSSYTYIFNFFTVHLIIPGLNDSTVKLPSSIMLEISDALKAQLGKQRLFNTHKHCDYVRNISDESFEGKIMRRRNCKKSYFICMHIHVEENWALASGMHPLNRCTF